METLEEELQFEIISRQKMTHANPLVVFLAIFFVGILAISAIATLLRLSNLSIAIGVKLLMQPANLNFSKC